ncbi:thiamine phosphate synthase [Thermoclostridium stercorarium]|uniref:thiamine phosphate synthase n=1 Tax=Thermoclostridium stercorarium TaxID=1510 RepID=UPI000A8273AB|nr:thiamine phosphate synthase [Thermoclostridium stercorarium]
MSIRKNLDISAYLVIGPENTNGRPVKKIIKDAVEAGFTCIQIRSKVASARELIELTREAAEVIACWENPIMWPCLWTTGWTLFWLQESRE